MAETEIVGVVGFGALGSAAGAALKRDGYGVMGFDPSPDARQKMSDLGVEVAADVAEVGRRCGVVIVFVASADQARQALIGPGAIYETMAGGTVLLQSTIGPEAVGEIARSCPAHLTFIDAPVTVRRSTPPTFFAFVGAAQPLSPSIRSVMDCYCHGIAFVGPVGAGQAVKVVNNIMAIVNTAVASEALRLAAAFGIDRETMIGLANKGSGASHALATWDTRKNLFDHPQKPSNAKKDLAAALKSARAAGLQLPMTEGAIALLET